jgi:hypothetical protein
MEMEVLILKKATGYASLKMLMDISGKDPIGIYRSIMFYRTKKIEGFNFFNEERGYICDRIESHLDFSLM